jgi:hypothetical protein
MLIFRLRRLLLGGKNSRVAAAMRVSDPQAA